MAQLILTEEEKEIASWLDMPDEDLGKAVRQHFVTLGNIIEKKKIEISALALHLACEAERQNCVKITYKLVGVSIKGGGIGDWEVTAEKVG